MFDKKAEEKVANTHEKDEKGENDRSNIIKLRKIFEVKSEVGKKGRVSEIKDVFETLMESKVREKTENEKANCIKRKLKKRNETIMTPGSIRKYIATEQTMNSDVSTLGEKRKVRQEKGETVNEKIDKVSEEKGDLEEISIKRSQSKSVESQSLRNRQVQSFKNFFETTPVPISKKGNETSEKGEKPSFLDRKVLKNEASSKYSETNVKKVQISKIRGEVYKTDQKSSELKLNLKESLVIENSGQKV